MRNNIYAAGGAGTTMFYPAFDRHCSHRKHRKNVPRVLDYILETSTPLALNYCRLRRGKLPCFHCVAANMREHTLPLVLPFPPMPHESFTSLHQQEQEENKQNKEARGNNTTIKKSPHRHHGEIYVWVVDYSCHPRQTYDPISSY